MHRLMSMNIKGTSVYLYPRIYPLVWRLFERRFFMNFILFSILWKKIKFHHQWFDVCMNDFLIWELMLLVR